MNRSAEVVRSLVARRLAVPLKATIKREPAAAVLQELNETQWWDEEQLHQLRTRRLRRLLIEVAAKVPFYRETIKALGADTKGDDPWSIFRRLPTIDKQRVRSLGAALWSEAPTRPPLLGHTSGTTGERLEVKIDRVSSTYRYLAGYRGRLWWGIEQGDSEFRIWGSGLRTARTRGDSILALVKIVKEWMMGVTLISPFFQSEDDLDQAVQLLLRRQPKLVFGYANSLYLLATHLRQRQVTVGPGWPVAVAYTSENISPRQRSVIEHAFGAPAIAEYGSCEAGVMAYQCPEGGIHASDDFMILETMDENGPVSEGTVGEVVVTNLVATEFPLIRYRHGDLARLGQATCRCGRGLGTIDALVGRLNDVFRSPGGGIIDFIVFDQAMKDQPAIRRFKIVEKRRGDLLALCETYGGAVWKTEDRDRFVSQCLALLPDDVRMSARSTDRLPPEPSGKFKIMVPEAEAGRYLG